MTNRFDDSRRGHTGCNELETWIRRAGACIEVSEQLRPRTLEMARHRRWQCHCMQRGLLVFATFALFSISLRQIAAPCHRPIFGTGETLVVSADREVQQLLASCSPDVRTSPTCQLADAFLQVRQRRARMFRDL